MIFRTGIINSVRVVFDSVSIIQNTSIRAIRSVDRFGSGINAPSLLAVVQIRDIVVRLLIRPDHKADLIGCSVFQHTKRRQVPVQITVLSGLIFDQRGNRHGVCNGIAAASDCALIDSCRVFCYGYRRTLRTATDSTIGILRVDTGSGLIFSPIDLKGLDRPVAVCLNDIVRRRPACLAVGNAAERSVDSAGFQGGGSCIQGDAVIIIYPGMPYSFINNSQNLVQISQQFISAISVETICASYFPFI